MKNNNELAEKLSKSYKNKLFKLDINEYIYGVLKMKNIDDMEKMIDYFYHRNNRLKNDPYSN